MKRIIIAGAGGLIGNALIDVFKKASYEILLISRSKNNSNSSIPIITWNENIADYIDGAQAVINLAGAPIAAKKWTNDYKRLIINSRTKSTDILVNAIKECLNPPKLINASAIGFYGDRANEELTEDSEPGNSFLADVCRQWENSANGAKQYTKVAICRIGIVLDLTNGALPKILQPYYYYIGGKLGSGKQWMSWIHIDDLTAAFFSIAENSAAAGIFNLVAPNPVNMAEFSSIISKILNKPKLFTVPAIILRLLLGESADLLLQSQKVKSKNILDMGFNFKFSNLEAALKNILISKKL